MVGDGPDRLDAGYVHEGGEESWEERSGGVFPAGESDHRLWQVAVRESHGLAPFQIRVECLDSGDGEVGLVGASHGKERPASDSVIGERALDRVQ